MIANSAPLVSVIMPTFERVPFLRGAVDSVFAQTYPHWQLIIADDGSGAETRAYLEGLRAVPRVTVLWLEHSGKPSVARNAALRAASGEHVAFLDSDDLWLPEKLERQVHSLRRHPDRSWGYTTFCLVDASGEPTSNALQSRHRAASGPILQRLLSGEIVIALPSVIVDRQHLERLGAFDEELAMCEDDELWLRLAAQGEADGIDEPLTLVRRHAEHGGNDRLAWRDRRRVFEKALRRNVEPPIRRTLRRLRAEAAAGLARSEAGADRRMDALRTLMASAPYSWRYPRWWAQAAQTLLRALAPPLFRFAAGRQRAPFLAQLWDLMTPAQRRAVIAMQLVSMLMAFSTVTGIAAIAPFFAVIGDHALIHQNAVLRELYTAGGFASTRTFIIALGVGFAGVVLLANVISMLGQLAMRRLALRIGNELQTTLFEGYLSRPYAFHCTNNSSALLNNVVYETTRVTHGVLENGFSFVTNLITVTLIVVSVALAKVAAAVAMLLALTAAYGAIYLGVRQRLLRNGAEQTRLANEQAQLVSEVLGAIKEISVLGIQEFFIARFSTASRSFLRAAAHAQLVGQSPKHLVESVAAAGLVAVALVLAGREGEAGPWLGRLTFLAFAAYRLLPMLQQLFVAAVRVRADSSAVHLLGEDLQRARALQGGASSVAQASAAVVAQSALRREIVLTRVSYRYAADRHRALRDVSVRIPALTSVAIVGPNGAGKSTLLDLVAGLLVPDSGALQVDGRLIDETNRAAWQRQIAYVPQNIFLFDASIAQNIALGVSASAIDPERLRSAARLAQLDELVGSLPDGYAQRIGERGVALSGGQRQRIGIARALYRDAPVLLMDEATIALDALTERDLRTTLANLNGRCTIVLVAHRMESVRGCDLIFELERGEVRGCGTYETLCQSSPAFRRLAEMR